MNSGISRMIRERKDMLKGKNVILGDAVLELVSSAYLFNEFPKVSEGELTKTRASMVCEPSLAMCARDIGLGDYKRQFKWNIFCNISAKDYESFIKDTGVACTGTGGAEASDTNSSTS